MRGAMPAVLRLALAGACLGLAIACASAARPSGSPPEASRSLSVTGFGAGASVNPRSVIVFQDRLLAALDKAGLKTTLVGEKSEVQEGEWLLRGRIVDLPVLGATSGLGRVVVHAELLRGNKLLLSKTYEEGVFFGVDGQGTEYTGDQPQTRAMGLAIRGMVKDVRRVMGRG